MVQPLGATPAPPQQQEQTSRLRMPLGDPQRYSRFVIIMKRALLLAALAVIAAVVIYSLEPRDQGRVAMTFQQMNKVAGDLTMVKPRLTGTDASGNPFVVTADSAVQDAPGSHRAKLMNVEADLSLKGGGWLTASAKEGRLDADAKKLTLSGPIAIYSDSGYELHTASARVDLAHGVMMGDDTVTGQGPLGTIRADHFEFDHNSKQVRLLGHVKMTLDLHAAHGARHK
ncbi:MAG: LPS export ABC transporter periplasmic protein LptC [Alphaproteobacteria bacterium]|nr:LPS export ABC transporter periplasmic protein LptC [Alphaproteobacteria bacterium]MDE2072311.1 LPS export ABC transporter periplasmic protein LptC [Alphaproteobacteria bacterium]